MAEFNASPKNDKNKTFLLDMKAGENFNIPVKAPTFHCSIESGCGLPDKGNLVGGIVNFYSVTP